VRDAHERVVDGVHEGVERRTVGAHEDEVGRRPCGEVDAAAHEVVEAELDVGHAQAQRGLAALGAERRLLLVGQVAVEVVVAELLGPARGLVAGIDLLRGRIRLVEVACGLELLDDLGVDVAAHRLPVRLVRAADADALVPFEAEPGERIEDLLVALLAVARGVGVFDAEHEGAAGVSRVRPVEEGGAHETHVRGSGR